MLVAKGRVALDRPVGRWVSDLLATTPAEIADFTAPIAVVAGQLENFHGDQADRIIFATAAALQVPLVTKDARLHDAAVASGDVTVVW